MGASITKPQQDQSKRLEQCNDPESSAAPHSAYGEPVLLNLGRKVFLSHSGKDKDFVRRLNSEIRRFYLGIEVAFFDEESIPKGKAINMEKSILEEARNSALGVLVLTDDFFVHTRNPMLELEAFVAGKVDLLPLFFKMSVDEFKQKKRWNRWEKKWKKWAAADDKLVIKNWRSYLHAVRTYNGLEFCKIAPDGREDLYIDEVVRQVAHIIGPVAPMSGKDVYGKDRLCQMVDDMYKECSSKRSSPVDRTATEIASTYDVVGIHGFSGLGKTTLSKCLCDFYFRKLKGNVCYIDLGLSSESRLSRMQHVLSRLDRGNSKDIYSPQLDSIQVENLLKQRLSSMQDPVFLAIDNIPSEMVSREEALIYLRCNFPKGSKIFITSRSEGTLRQLTNLIHHSRSFSAVIEYMPELEFEEARDIFKHEFPDLHNSWHSNLSAAEENIQRDVDTCVRKCTIFRGMRYHPLMLKSLAAFVKWDELMPSLDWKGRLAKLASDGIVHKDDAWEQVFQLFDITFRLLTEEEKKVFLDLAVCYSATIMRPTDYYEWIQMLHLTHILKERRMEKMLLRLHNFCFIEKEGPVINIHDIMVEFGKHKAGADISDGYLVLEDGGPSWLDPLPRTVRHVSISRCGKDQLRTLDLMDVEGVTVLHLLDNAGLGEVLLSRSSTAYLRSMIVSVPAGTALRCIVNEDWSSHSLKWLKIKGNFNFCFQPASQRSLMLPDARMDPGSMLLGGFRNLEHFKLDSLLHCNVQTVDLTPCANLKLLEVKYMPGLKSIRGPERSTHLEKVFILSSPHLEELAFTVPDHSTYFSIQKCASLQKVTLNCTTPSISYAGALQFRDCPLLSNVDGLSQYMADGNRSISLHLAGSVQQYMFWTQIFVDMVKDTRIDASQCKATVRDLQFYADNPVGLGGVRVLDLEDAQHIGPLISALFQAQPTHLIVLKVQCQQAGDCSSGCTCDQNPPNFRVLPLLEKDSSSDQRLEPEFHYCCQQVRDLSSLAQWRSLRKLTLRGCTSVEVWPDFAAMTSLCWLDLSNNTLREWPAGVLLLPDLDRLDLRGCPQLPAKELMLRTITPTHPWDSETNSWYSALPLRLCRWAFASLREDLRDGTRDRCTVAVALGELSVELAAIFDRWWPDSTEEEEILHAILELMYEVWFHGGGGPVNADEEQHISEIMRALLSSDSLLSLPFRSCSTDCIRWSFCHTRAVIGALGVYTGGQGSSTYSHRALPDHYLRDRTIFFFKNIIGSLIESVRGYNGYFLERGCIIDQTEEPLTDEEMLEVVGEEVGVALSTMAREAGLEVEEGSTDSEELQELRERAVEALCTVARNAGMDVVLQVELKDEYPRWPFDFPNDLELKNVTVFESIRFF